MKLRPYQESAKVELRTVLKSGLKRVVLYSPTGSGKSVMAMDLIKSITGNGKKVAFIANRIGLVHQFSEHLSSEGIQHGIIQGGNTYGTGLNCVVCSIQTLGRRGLPPVDFVIIDECHAVPGSNDYKKLIFSLNNIYWIGLTATPFAKGMAKVHVELSNEPLFQELVIAATIRDLINQGNLVDCEIYAPHDPDLKGVRNKRNQFGEMDYNEQDLGLAIDKPELIGDIVTHWLKLATNKKTVVFATNVIHSKHIVSEFVACGFKAEHIDGYMTPEEKQPILDRFKNGETKIISNVAMLKEGWDVPSCEVMILAKPTKSLTAWVQMVGRILRPFEGKQVGIVLDHSGSVNRLGYPTDDLPLELCDGSDKKKSEQKEPPPKKENKCPKCHFIKKTLICPKCGFKAEKTNDVEVGIGELTKVERRVARSDLQAWYSQLLCFEKSKNYNHGWAANKYREKFGIWPRKLTDTHIQPGKEVLDWLTSRQIAWRATQKKLSSANEISKEEGMSRLTKLKEMLG